MGRCSSADVRRQQDLQLGQIFEYFIYFSLVIWCMTFFYIVNFLRRSGVTDLPFLQVISGALFGNISNFYRAFYTVHSHKHKASSTKFILILNISSILCFFVVLLSIAFLSIWFDI